MDQITKSLLDDFTNQFELDRRDTSVAFEHFCNYILLSRNYRYTFPLEDVHIGGGGDGGIDGLAIIVNGRMVTTIDEINDLVTATSYLDVDLIFIQSKTSTNFSGSEIGSFFLGAKVFVLESPSFIYNEKLKLVRELWDYIIQEKSADMVRRLPTVVLYYATTGKWKNDQNLLTVIDNGKKELQDTSLFSTVKFIPCGALDLQKFYRDTKNKLEVTVNFSNKITLPDINGVTEAYFGILPFLEFKKLIHDDNQTIYPIFYDNVRDFQGEDNLVNQAITTTLTNQKFDLFCVLNNGVTIVTRSLTPAGNRFTLRDYQIVNGCQTSHILSANSVLDGIENVNVPVRIIVTSDDEIKNQITKATNSQTEIKPEQLAAQTDFQKSLEQYYDSIKGIGRLHYERRSGQYRSEPVIKSKIITMQIQIKAFTAMFLDAPHSVSGYYGTIAEKFDNRLFGEDHKLSPYYTCGLAYYRLETLFRNGSIDAVYKKARYHLLMIARILGNRATVPRYNSHEMDRFCEVIIRILNDQQQYLDLFQRCVDIFNGSGLNLAQKQFKSEGETFQILNHIRNIMPESLAGYRLPPTFSTSETSTKVSSHEQEETNGSLHRQPSLFDFDE